MSRTRCVPSLFPPNELRRLIRPTALCLVPGQHLRLLAKAKLQAQLDASPPDAVGHPGRGRSDPRVGPAAQGRVEGGPSARTGREEGWSGGVYAQGHPERWQVERVRLLFQNILLWLVPRWLIVLLPRLLPFTLCSSQAQTLSMTLYCSSADDSEDDPRFVSYVDNTLSLFWNTQSACALSDGQPPTSKLPAKPPAGEGRGFWGWFFILCAVFDLAIVVVLAVLCLVGR